MKHKHKREWEPRLDAFNKRDTDLERDREMEEEERDRVMSDMCVWELELKVTARPGSWKECQI